MFSSFALSLALIGAGPPPEDWGDFDDFEFTEPSANGDATALDDEDEVARPADADSSSKQPAKAERSSVDDIMAGSLRLTGAFIHFDDVPELYPNGDDGIFLGVARMMIDHSWARTKLEINVFADLQRSVPNAGSAGAFTSAGATESAYRHAYLTVPYWQDGSIRGRAGFDRMKLAVDAGPVAVEVGRFPISTSVTNFLTPNDFFAPFSATAINTMYKPGVDALRVSVAPGPLSSIEVISTMGFSDGYAPSWGHAALLARLSAVRWGFQGSLMGGKIAERWMVGGSLQGDIGRVGLRAEGHVGIPDLDGDGRRGDDLDHPIYGRVAGGPNVNFAWRSLTVGAEYAYLSDGADRPADYIDRASRLYPDDLPYLAQHYVGVVLGLQPIPILSAGAVTFVNATDGSGLVGLNASYSISNEADLILGSFIPWGPSARATANPLMPVELASEFGAGGFTLYLESRVFF